MPGEETYYIISPADVIKANPRTEDDHIQWLIKHNKFEVSSTVVSSFRLVLVFMKLNTCFEVHIKAYVEDFKQLTNMTETLWLWKDV